jgi:hypothetical protein
MGVIKYLPNKLGLKRSSDLTGVEVVRLYHAASFSMWRDGPAGIFNTHITILWNTLGIHDHQLATKLLGRYLNRAVKWAAVGSPETPRRRRRARTGDGFTFRYIFVNENGAARQFHSHILCSVPRPLVPVFAAWTRSILRRLAKHYGDEHTVKVIASQERDERGAVTRCWSWVQYICKQLDPQAGNWTPVDRLTGAFLPGGARPLREILRVKPHRTALPVTSLKLTGASRDLSSAAQRAAGFQPPLRYGDPQHIIDGRLFDGQELEIWRAAEREKQAAAARDKWLHTLAID